MMDYLDKFRRRVFPGETVSEIVFNELKDFFVIGPYRRAFFVMGVYSVFLMAITIIATNYYGYFSVDSSVLIKIFFLLGGYFILSDLVKRKKLLGRRTIFIIDSACFASFMYLIVYSTGGHESPIRYPLFFLTAISAPIYGTMFEAVFFLFIVGAIQLYLTYHNHGFAYVLAFDALEGLSWMTAAIIIRTALDTAEKKNVELAKATEEQGRLYDEIQSVNKNLEKIVAERTVALEKTLALARQGEEGLKKQKGAIFNILEDMNEERNKTMVEKEKLSRILQSIGDAVVVVDRDRRIIIFNQVAERITGYLAGEAAGKHYSEVLKFYYEKDHAENDVIGNVFKKGVIQQLSNHTVVATKEGKEVPVDDSAAPIFDNEGEVLGCIMVFRDVTREREIDRQKSEFVSVASHQLRTPLTSIRWFVEMLLDGDLGELNQGQIDTLKQIFESSERMIDLVNKLLNISRIESGRVRVAPEPTDINEIIRSVTAETMPLVKNKKISMAVKAIPLPKINLDRKLVGEAVMNIVSNAIKYTPEGGKINITVSKDAKNVLVKIADSGIGIPKKDQPKMFAKFFRAENAVTSETEGTGMGLYVVKSIIELSGGKIWFESAENKGSTFFFTLPLKGSIMKEGEKSLV